MQEQEIGINIDDSANIEVAYQDEVYLDIESSIVFIESGKKEIDRYVKDVAEPNIDKYVVTVVQPKFDAEIAKAKGYADQAKATVDGFDQHALDEQAKFDANATEKTDTFNAGVEQASQIIQNQAIKAITDFDKNATEATNGFNTNAMTKIDDFDAHAMTKEIEFDDNASEKQALVDASASKAKQSEINAKSSEDNAKLSEINSKTNEDNSRLWAVGTIGEKPEGSSKYWAEQAQSIVGEGVIDDNKISLDTTYSSDKLEKIIAVNEDHDSVLDCDDILDDNINAKTTVPLSSLHAIDSDARPSHKAKGAEVYDDVGTKGIIDSVTPTTATIITKEVSGKGKIVDTLDIHQNGLGQYYVALTANEIRNEIIKGKIVQLSFDDTITNTGEQLYPFETMDKQGYAVFRRNVITEEKAERINIKVDYQGIVTFEKAVLNALLKSGGSMSGALKFDDSGYIEANNSSATKGLALFGSKDGYGNGASLSLRDNTATGEQAGEFKLETGNNITGHTHTFRGHPDGKLYWDNTELANINLDNISQAGKNVIKANVDLSGKANTSADNFTKEGKSLLSSFGMPSSKWYNLGNVANGTTLIAPANGYYVGSLLTNADGGFLQMVNNSTSGVQCYIRAYATNIHCRGFVPVSKGQKCLIGYDKGTLEYIRFVYAQGEK